MGIGLFSNTVKKTIRRRALDKSFYASKRIIKFKSRDYTARDIEYWSNYYVTPEILKMFNVRSVHKLLNEANEVTYTVSQRTLTYAYIIYNKVKLYRPEESLEFKWRNTCPGHYIQGLQQVLLNRTGNRKLIITKSLKDVMVFYRFLGDKYDIIAPHSETYIFTEKLLSLLDKMYDEKIIIFDYDLAGVQGVNRLRKTGGDSYSYTFVSTRRIKLNGSLKVIDKDISDYVVDRSEYEIMNHLKQIGLL